MAERGRDFADLAHRVIFSEKRFPAARVAEAMGSTPHRGSVTQTQPCIQLCSR